MCIRDRLNIAISPLMYGAVLLAMCLLSTLASGVVARRSVNKPITEALSHV